MERTIVYIDGFNLYFGLKTSGLKRFYWLNVKQMALSVLKRDQILVEIKYFTSRIKDNPGKAARQSKFIDAISTLADLKIFYGMYQANSIECHACKAKWDKSDEKMTDVNIATELLVDAFGDAFDTAIVVSADSDLVPPIAKIVGLFPKKKVTVAFPPERKSKHMKKVASAWFDIGRDTIANSQFPNVVKTANGYDVVKPSEWV